MFSRVFQKLLKGKYTKKVSVSDKGNTENKSNITATRIGDLGEYKINIQLDQLPKNSKYLSDILINNPNAKSGYSQIDHVIFTPYAIFVIETKNCAGTIYGDRNRGQWSVNGKFPVMNPFHQNYGHIQAIKTVLELNDEILIVSMVSFTKRCTFKVNEEIRKIQSNDLIVYDTELSEFILRKINVLKLQNPEPLFSIEELQELYNKLNVTNITDSQIRESHVEKLREKGSKEIVKSDSIQSTCKTCGKVVSEKVSTYCLSHEDQFKGNTYCFEHQKNHK